MKLTSLFVLSLGLTLGFSFAEEENVYTGLHLAYGLEFDEENDEITGWHDANKNGATDGDADDNMCYAASASNLIAWWQNSDRKVASNAPQKLEDIWQTYKDNNQIWDQGGDTGSALNWWISGIYMPVADDTGESWAPADDPIWQRYYATPDNELYESEEASKPLALTLPNNINGGYYYDQYGLTQSDLSNFIVSVWTYEPSEELDAAEAPDEEGLTSISDVDFVEIFEDSAVGLAICDDAGELAHAITLWGVTLDEDGNLATMWLTDSDDLEEGIFSVSVTMDEDANKIYFGEWNEKEGAYINEAYWGCTNVYIDGIFAINTSEAANWQLVPEPATATLSLLALASLVTRRRRK